jgi:hypothetical protein
MKCSRYQDFCKINTFFKGNCMSLAAMLAALGPFAAALEPLLASVEGEAMTELNGIIAKVSSPDLKLLLQALSGAVNSFATAEIAKI